MLGNLLARTDRARFEPAVVSLIDDLRLADGILASGIPVRVAGMRPGVLDPLAVARLAGLVRRERPGVIQTWMDHSNFLGGIAARLALRARGVLVWGVHHSRHVRGVTKRTTLMTVSACARLSRRVPSRIVCCSEQARAEYARRGFAAEKLVVIPNGFDTLAFRPNSADRARVREELGLGPMTPLVGLVARYDPVKDHANFLRAAALLRRRGRVPGIHFLLCGDGVDRGNAALTSAVESFGLRDCCHLMGPRRDVARIQASLDLATSSSLSEAFPLCLGEAMSCGVPCVATDVGDSAEILGETGRVVPPRSPSALADAWEELLGLDPEARVRLGLAARRRVQSRYDLASVARRYETLYQQLIDGNRDADGPSHGPRRPASACVPQR